MPGGDKKIHEHPNANINGFDKRPEDAKNGGRKPSIRNALKEVMGSDGIIFISEKEVVNNQAERKGKGGKLIKGIEIRVTNDVAAALMLQRWIKTSKGNESLKAIQLAMEQIDGKPPQEQIGEQTLNVKVSYDRS